jgi:hypothetical protein
MSGPRRPFDPSEIDATTPALSSVARTLEELARSETVAPSAGFEDRVMAAIALEPEPRRAAAAGGGLAGLFGAVGLAWRDAWDGTRPGAVRAQALARLVVVRMIASSVGAIATVGVSNVLFPDEPRPTVQPPPSHQPTVAPTAAPHATPAPTPVATPVPTPSASPTPSMSPEPTGTDGAGATQPPHTAKPTTRPTSKPTAKPTPHPTGTDDPEDTPEPTGNDGDEHEDATPHPTDSDHDETPQPTDDAEVE